jgi:hypothetical protein
VVGLQLQQLNAVLALTQDVSWRYIQSTLGTISKAVGHESNTGITMMHCFNGEHSHTLNVKFHYPVGPRERLPSLQ